jgi:hypothetical protein
MSVLGTYPYFRRELTMKRSGEATGPVPASGSAYCSGFAGTLSQAGIRGGLVHHPTNA